MTRRINAAGLAIIKRNEGCVLHAYPDPATGGDPWTIGYGHTGPEVRPGLEINQAGAEQLLRQDLAKFEAGVLAYLGGAPATDNQFAAMVSLAYNIGLGHFLTSTVLRLHKAGDYQGAADAFAMWNKAGGRVLKGLTRRRAEEAKLYLTGGVSPPGPTPEPPEPTEDDDTLDQALIAQAAITRIIQAELDLPVDGDYGPATRAAVRAYMKDRTCEN